MMRRNNELRPSQLLSKQSITQQHNSPKENHAQTYCIYLPVLFYHNTNIFDNNRDTVHKTILKRYADLQASQHLKRTMAQDELIILYTIVVYGPLPINLIT